ncbi:hypothetical protein Nepgr_005464 [Nepenthes gracilis]|uniref:CUE domain-containing protein n=1 Tax=Nepenthes gracilis TaxID=150966 RepID=A0AAD3S382_NEPGR|nr:hypothetical protein Nepgr_005464 [Nepenthes gracilis]
MPAIVCGKRSFFEDLPSASTPVSTKVRCSSSTSPVRCSQFSPSPLRSSLVDRLTQVFPRMDQQLLEKVLEECGDEIDATIKRLRELCLESSEATSVPVKELKTKVEQVWILMELLVLLMILQLRTLCQLIVLEKSIAACAHAEVAGNLKKENMMLKQQDTILAHGVLNKHECQKEYDAMYWELQHLKQLVSHYQEQLRRLEVSNYTLRMHLKQAQESSSMPGCCHPDVF